MRKESERLQDAVFERGQLVRVFWRDAVCPAGSWVGDEVLIQDSALMESVGFLAERGKTFLTLYMCRDLESPRNMGMVFRIPTGCVERVEAVLELTPLE